MFGTQDSAAPLTMDVSDSHDKKQKNKITVMSLLEENPLLCVEITATHVTDYYTKLVVVN